MNILFVGPYRQQDGWGLATQSYIKALGTRYNNITTRPIYFSSGDPNYQPDEQILSYENTYYDNYDVVIQKVLPHNLFLNKKYKKNIGLFVLETNNIGRSRCIKNINQMDEIWVPSNQEKICLQKSGVTTSIKTISQPLDTDFILQNKNHKIPLHSGIDRTFKFYFIGEYNERKNLLDLIAAFHLAFDVTQPVSLIIKSSVSGLSPQESHKVIEKDIDNLKIKLNISTKYKKEIIITERLSDKDLIGLHNACDCFVMPSRGEAFCRPAAEALVLGKTPIVTNNTGMTDYINNDNGFIIKSHRIPVVINNRPLSNDFDLYNAHEYWNQIDLYGLIHQMQEVYSMHKNNKQKLLDKQSLGSKYIDQFSYKNIGDKLCI